MAFSPSIPPSSEVAGVNSLLALLADPVAHKKRMDELVAASADAATAVATARQERDDADARIALADQKMAAATDLQAKTTDQAAALQAATSARQSELDQYASKLDAQKATLDRKAASLADREAVVTVRETEAIDAQSRADDCMRAALAMKTEYENRLAKLREVVGV